MRPRVDVGKSAKQSGALKPREARKLEKAMRVPPHKKPRTYVLTVEWTETYNYRETKKYTTRAARNEARVRKKKELEAQGQRYIRWYGPSHEYHFDGPTFIETEEKD